MYGEPPEQAQQSTVTGNLQQLPAVSALSQGINAINLGYQAGAIPGYSTLTGNVSDAAAHLLNPADAQANYDVSMQGAESAVGRGIVGSGAAAETTGRLRQADIERRAMLGNQLLSSQVQRLPAPFNPASQLVQPSQVHSQDAALLRDLIARGNPTGGKTYTNLAGAGGGGGVMGPGGRFAAPAAAGMGFQPLSLPDSGDFGYDTPTWEPDTAAADWGGYDPLAPIDEAWGASPVASDWGGYDPLAPIDEAFSYDPAAPIDEAFAGYDYATGY